MNFSPVLASYRAATAVLGPFAGAYLNDRARRGKEDPARLEERFGRYQQARPSGTLVWMHAASVGESAVAMALIDAMSASDASLSFLLTTGTRTSAELVARRAPARTLHVYSPLDRADSVRKFLDHWRPDLGVFLESELWPNLILAARSRGVKLALVNARMSPKSLRRWRSWREAGRHLIGAFEFVSAADSRTAEALSDLRGDDVPAPGNLKLAAPPPRVDASARDALAAQIRNRPLWLAASTHGGEDAIVLKAHDLLRAAHPEALLIIAPRHPERGEDISHLAGGAPMRSRGGSPEHVPYYIADTLGELGTLYDLAPVALVAGSLLPHLKGHNPIEPAKLGAAIITGPHVESFQDVFDALLAADGATVAHDPDSLAAAVAELWRNKDAREKQVAAARSVASQGVEAFAQTLAQLAAMTPTRRPASASA